MEAVAQATDTAVWVVDWEMWAAAAAAAVEVEGAVEPVVTPAMATQVMEVPVDSAGQGSIRRCSGSAGVGPMLM